MTEWIGWMTTTEGWISLLTLTLLEVVLGIDNLIFISILSSKLPEEQRSRARRYGLGGALITRILLLCSLVWIMRLSRPLWEISVFGLQLPNTGRDLVLVCGGLFLIWKSVHEIHDRLEGSGEHGITAYRPTFASVVVQILLLDIVFSLDSVITAVGMAKYLGVMVLAVVIAMILMIVYVNTISAFVERHPTVKMLALAFLILIGTLLVAEGFHQEINKGYIYFAMFFALAVEFLNQRVREKSIRQQETRQ